MATKNGPPEWPRDTLPNGRVSAFEVVDRGAEGLDEVIFFA